MSLMGLLASALTPFNLCHHGSQGILSQSLLSQVLFWGWGAGTSNATIPGCLGWKVAWPLAAPGSRVVGSVGPSGQSITYSSQSGESTPLEAGSDCRGQFHNVTLCHSDWFRLWK